MKRYIRNLSIALMAASATTAGAQAQVENLLYYETTATAIPDSTLSFSADTVPDYIPLSICDSIPDIVEEEITISADTIVPLPDSPFLEKLKKKKKEPPVSIYALPYSMTGNSYDWKRLWINTAVLAGAFTGSLLVLECLPEDATSWNRAELQDVPLLKRWDEHVVKEGPEWDHDKIIFNYVLHPYAGAAYFMAARSCGFNFWRSFLYCSIVSNVGWEYGIEAFMERPSIQDLFITPVVGSCIGEGFYHIKRYLVDHDYRLLGSPVIGGIVAFLVDPVNEFTGLFLGNPARREAHARAAQRKGGAYMSLAPSLTPRSKGFAMTVYF